MHVCGVQFVSPHLPETASSTGEADVLKRQAEHELCRNPPFSSDLKDTGCRFTAHVCSYIIIRVYYINTSRASATVGTMLLSAYDFVLL